MPEASSRIEELQRELTANPASRQFYQLGELLRRDGREAEAVEALRLGLTHHPKYLAAWVSLGRALVQAGDPAGAATALRSAIDLDQQNPVAWHLLGDALLGVGDRAGALNAMRKALALVPGDEVLQSAVDELSQEPAAPPAEHHEAAAAEEEAAAVPSFEEALAAQKAPDYDTIGVISDVEPAGFHEIETPSEPVPGLIRDIPEPPPEQVEGLERFGFEAALPAPTPAPAPEADPFAVTGACAPGAAASDDVFGDAFAAASEPHLALEGPFAGGAGGPGPAAGSYEAAPAVPEAPTVADRWAGERLIGAPEIQAEGPLETERTAEVTAPPRGEVVSVSPDDVAAEAPELLEHWEDSARAVEPDAIQNPVAADAAPISALAAWLRHGEAAPGDAAALAGLVAPAAAEPRPPAPGPASQPATITLARLYIQQQDFPSATATLERMLESDPGNQEARDLLELVHDMMGPMPEALPPLASKERKIAALQRWAANLTLGRERMGR